MDFVVYTADEELLRTSEFRNGKVIVALGEPGGDPFGAPITRFYAGVDLHSRYSVLPIRIEDTGLTPSTLAFNFRVQQEDMVERGQDGEAPYDQVPGGAGWLRFDARTPRLVPEQTTVEIAGEREATIEVARGTGYRTHAGAGLLVLLPANAPGDGDVALLAVPPEPVLFLPQLGTLRR